MSELHDNTSLGAYSTQLNSTQFIKKWQPEG